MATESTNFYVLALDNTLAHGRSVLEPQHQTWSADLYTWETDPAGVLTVYRRSDRKTMQQWASGGWITVGWNND